MRASIRARTDMTRICSIVLSVLGLAFASGEAWAQTWSTRPIRAIVAFSAGGIVDVMARVVFDQLSTQLRQPVIVENRAGAGTTIAAALPALVRVICPCQDASSYYRDASSRNVKSPKDTQRGGQACDAWPRADGHDPGRVRCACQSRDSRQRGPHQRGRNQINQSSRPVS